MRDFKYISSRPLDCCGSGDRGSGELYIYKYSHTSTAAGRVLEYARADGMACFHSPVVVCGRIA